MATYDQTLNGKNNQKKGVCASSATLNFTDQAVASTETVSVFTLPENAVVTNAFFFVKTGLSNTTATGKVTIGSTDTIAAVAFAGVDGVLKGGSVTKVHTGTGAEVTVTIGTANATDGEVEVVVEYIEYTKTTGELTTV